MWLITTRPLRDGVSMSSDHHRRGLPLNAFNGYIIHKSTVIYYDCIVANTELIVSAVRLNYVIPLTTTNPLYFRVNIVQPFQRITVYSTGLFREMKFSRLMVERDTTYKIQYN